MAILLGIDTGGTYTDAVLYDEDAPAPGIVAKAKALTTHHDLSIGIAGATDAMLARTPGAGIALGWSRYRRRSRPTRWSRGAAGASA
jgi:N-methylhydantoinase A/oxoprolinase/acetone carboxylase beta subunit